MRKFLTTALFFVWLTVPAMAGDGLSAFLSNVNIQARTDMNGFAATVSAQFGVPQSQVWIALGNVSEPADAFMIFQLGQMTGQYYDTVMRVYQTKKGHGWGVIAKELGIKPGSPEFHALKSGNLYYGTSQSGQGNSGKGQSKDKSQGKGQSKDKGQGKEQSKGKGKPND